MTEPKPRTSRWWILIAVLATLVLYPLSFGPASWMATRTWLYRDYERQMRLLNGIYAPVFWIHKRSPPVVQEQIENYANLGMTNGTVTFFIDRICFFENAAPGAPFALGY